MPRSRSDPAEVERTVGRDRDEQSAWFRKVPGETDHFCGARYVLNHVIREERVEATFQIGSRLDLIKAVHAIDIEVHAAVGGAMDGELKSTDAIAGLRA